MSYKGVGWWFEGGHQSINQAKFEHARGDVSTNEVKSYFAMLKCGIIVSFHSVSKKHLHRYCDEFSFRWNERKVTEAERTVTAIVLSNTGRPRYKEPISKRA